MVVRPFLRLAFVLALLSLPFYISGNVTGYNLVKTIGPGTCFLDSWLYFSAYARLSALSCLTSSRESPEMLTISSKAYLPAANIRSATSFIPSFNV